MRKLYRSLLWTGVLAIGVAACGDDVTVTNPPPPPPAPEPGIRSVTVGPDGAHIAVGGTVQMSAAVTTDPGAATPSIAWSTSSAARATVSGSGLVTGVSAGSAAIKATATSGTSTGEGVATVIVDAPAACVVSAVTATPATATLVPTQTVQATASVNFTGPCTGNVTWASLSPAIASVSATGLITANAGGNAVITVASADAGFASKSAAIAVTVVVPDPATVSIEKVEYNPGGGSVPVMLTNVFGQIEVTANVDKGDKVLDRLDVTIDGQVVATQIYPPPAAPAGGPSLAPVQNTISVNTAQVRKVGGLFVPVVFNGNANIGLNLYIVGSAAPIASNTVPVVMNNPDAITTNGANGPMAVALANPAAPSFTDASPRTWYQSHVNFSGINYMAFGGVNPTSVAVGNTLGCSNSNVRTGTPASGVAVSGTWNCGTSPGGLEGSVGYNGAFPGITVGAAPAPEVTVTAPTGWSRVSTAFVVGNDNIAAPADARYNLLTGGSTSSSAFWVDWKGAVAANTAPIGFLSGGAAPSNCELTGITPGCWINASGAIASKFSVTDGGSGALGGNSKTVRDYTGGGVSCSAAILPTGTGADYAETTVANAYRACAHGADPLGNVSGFAASNAFSVDKTTPIFAYVGTFGPAGTNPAEVNAQPGAGSDIIDFSLTDGNSGLAGAVALTFTFTKTVQAGGAQVGPTNGSLGACPNPTTALTGGGNTPQTMATPYNVTTCTLPGERTWSAFGRDRAGNASSTITRQMEFNPAPPVMNAVNIVPNYGAATALELDVLATDDEDLRGYEMWAHHTTNVGNDIVVKFGPLGGFGNIWGTDWDASLYLLTTLGTDSRVGIPAAYSLRGYVESAAGWGANTADLDTLSVLVYDTYGTPSSGVSLALNPAFVVGASYPETNAFGGIAPGVLTPTLWSPTGSSCAFDYSTPTNNPQILMRIWAMNDADPANPNAAGGGAAGSYTVLSDISTAPALLSDNGIQRLYRHTISSSRSCTAAGWGITGGVNNIFVINANQAWEVY